MRFMMMHKNDPHTEAGLPPSMEIVHQMGAFIGKMAQEGRFVDGAGLGGSKTRTRLRFKGGNVTVQHGPYSGEHELPYAALLLEVKTREEALGWATRYGKILGDGEIELGKLNEPWDIGLVPAPADPPLHFLLVDKSDAATEAGGRSPKLKAELTRLETEMRKAGVLQRGYRLAPSKQAKRLHYVNHDLRVVDGPFAETKELLGGFGVLELASFEEAIAMSREYAKILGGTLEIDMRIVEPDDGAGA